MPIASEHTRPLDAPLRLPNCQCSDPDCKALRELADRILVLLYEHIPDAGEQVIVATMVTSRLMINLNISAFCAGGILADNVLTCAEMMARERYISTEETKP